LYIGSTEPAQHPLPSTAASNGVQQDVLFPQLDDNLELGPEHLTSRQFRLQSESTQDIQLENIPLPLENWPTHSCTPHKEHTSVQAASANATVIDFLIEQLLNYSCSCQISRDIPEDSTTLSQIPCVVEAHLAHLGVLESEDMLKKVNIDILPEAWQQIFEGKVVPEQESMCKEDTINKDNSADNEGEENESEEDISMNQNRPLKMGGNACPEDNSHGDDNNPI